MFHLDRHIAVYVQLFHKFGGLMKMLCKRGYLHSRRGEVEPSFTSPSPSRKINGKEAMTKRTEYELFAIAC